MSFNSVFICSTFSSNFKIFSFYVPLELFVRICVAEKVQLSFQDSLLEKFWLESGIESQFSFRNALDVFESRALFLLFCILMLL